jgi:hypothetical protein
VCYRRDGVAKDRQNDALIRKLVEAIEVSLTAAQAARDAVQEILKRGADTGLFFSGGPRAGNFSSELTSRDREFLRAVSIKPDR